MPTIGPHVTIKGDIRSEEDLLIELRQTSKVVGDLKAAETPHLGDLDWERNSTMDKPHHPKVFRSWKVER